MAFQDKLESEPWRFDYFTVLRQLERTFKGRPRIGDSATVSEEFVKLGQDPFMAFPGSNIAGVVQSDDQAIKIFTKFLGLLGPQGALPLAITEEAYFYHLAQDDAFARFLDIFNHRFLQLFFRAWADARPIAQHDRPEADRFVAYIGSAIGIGSTPYQNLDSVPDAAKLGFAGLIGAQAKSASRLGGAICGIFNVRAEVEEFVGSRLVLEDTEWSTLGRNHCRLGQDTLLGRTIFSVQDKIRVRIFTNDLAQYARLLPTGDLCEPLADFIFFYDGEQNDCDIELAIPAGSAEPVRLGRFGQLGWTSWMAPNWTSMEAYRRDARFHPGERMSLKRSRSAKSQKGGRAHG